MGKTIRRTDAAEIQADTPNRTSAPKNQSAYYLYALEDVTVPVAEFSSLMDANSALSALEDSQWDLRVLRRPYNGEVAVY